MDGIISLLSKCSVGVLLLSAACASAGTLAQCPRVHADGIKTGVLADADLFQGPPENLASLIPDLDTSEWDLHGYQEASEERGEPLYLVCRYAGIKATVKLEVPRAATFCRVEGSRHGTVAFCGTNSSGPKVKSKAQLTK